MLRRYSQPVNERQRQELLFANYAKMTSEQAGGKA